MASRVFHRFFAIERTEIPFALRMFFFWFLVIAIFQIIKPLKNGLFIETYGAQNELYAKLLNIVLAAVGALVFSWLHHRLRRLSLTFTFAVFFAANFLFIASLLKTPGRLTIWWFYLLGDLISTIWVTAFWAYVTDLTDSEQAARLFGMIGAGGVIGGWVGAAVARLLLIKLGASGLLMLCAGLMMTVAAIVGWNEKRLAVKPQPTLPHQKKGSNLRAALEGIRLVRRSTYLAAIVGILSTYEFISQILDFVFKSAVESLQGASETQLFLANVYLGANILSVFVQFFLVSYILRRWGVTAGLFVLPVALLISSLIYLVHPLLTTAALFVIFDNGLNYSIQQTSRETLYIPTSPNAKYRARAFTNMFVQRFAKGLGIGLVLVLSQRHVTASVLVLGAMVMVGLMMALSWFAGGQYQKRLTTSGVSVAADIGG